MLFKIYIKIIWKSDTFFYFKYLLQTWIVTNYKLFNYLISNDNSYKYKLLMKNLLKYFRKEKLLYFKCFPNQVAPTSLVNITLDGRSNIELNRLISFSWKVLLSNLRKINPYWPLKKPLSIERLYSLENWVARQLLPIHTSLILVAGILTILH